MGLWGSLKSIVKGAATKLLPFLIQGGLEEYRKKNPKSGWIIDAVQGSLESHDQEMGFRSLSLEAKAEQLAKKVRQEFPAMDLETVRAISRAAVAEKYRTDKKGT